METDFLTKNDYLECLDLKNDLIKLKKGGRCVDTKGKSFREALCDAIIYEEKDINQLKKSAFTQLDEQEIINGINSTDFDELGYRIPIETLMRDLCPNDFNCRVDCENSEVTMGVTDNGIEYAEFEVCGDGQGNTIFYVYSDGKQLRAYIPIFGNTAYPKAKVTASSIESDDEIRSIIEENFKRANFKPEADFDWDKACEDVGFLLIQQQPNYLSCLDDFKSILTIINDEY